MQLETKAQLLRRAERPQTLSHLSLRLSTAVKRPAERCTLPDGIPDTRLIVSLLFGVKPADPLAIGIATILMMVVAAVGSFLPARRASTVDPMVALRYE